MEMKCIKSVARVSNKNCVNKGDLDLSKNVLWVSVGQGVADLQAVKVECQKRFLPISRVRAPFARNEPIGRIFF